MNIDEPFPDPDTAWWRVLKIQTKLHQWATDDSHRRFVDLYNLVYDPAVLADAWHRVRTNRGARSAGVDGRSAAYVSVVVGEQAFLSELRDDLKARRFHPLPVREVMIPKPGGKRRRLGIATVRDRVVQAALKTVLEPIFEADFKPCSYGFRPRRRVQDAIAEIHFYTSRSYEWIVEGDIKACFDEISHTDLMDRVRARIGDKRVMDLVKAFLKAGILGEDQVERASITGAPQGGILSPLLSNIALSALDEHFAEAWSGFGPGHARQARRKKGLANYRLVRYADDCVTRMHRRDRCRRSSYQMQCCAEDGGRSTGIALQGEVPNHRKVRRSRAGVLSVAEKAGREPVRCEPRRRARANHPMTGRKRSGDIKSGVELLPRYQSGRHLFTAQAVSGLKVARARLRLRHGTCEPVPRYRPGRSKWAERPPVGESEDPKWQNPRGAE